MLGQLWLEVELPEEGVVEELPLEPLDVDPLDVDPLAVDPLDLDPLDVDPLDLDPLDVDPLEVEAMVVCAVAGEPVVVVAVAAETPSPRLSPRALAAIPAATKGCFSFMR